MPNNLFPTSETATNRYADIILPLALPQMLTYGVPVEYQDVIQPGLRAEVSLGKNKQYAGVVARLHNERPEAYEVKPIRGLLDEMPVVNSIQLEFWKWIADYYVAAPGEVMQAALPAHLKLSSETKLQWRNGSSTTQWSEMGLIAANELRHRGSLVIPELRKLVGNRFLVPVIHELLQAEAVIINDGLEETFKRKTERVISLGNEYQEEQALHHLFETLKRAPKQLETLMSFLALSARSGGEISQEILLKDARANAPSVRALSERGVFQIDEKEVDRINTKEVEAAKEITFTKAQEKAYKQIHEGLIARGVVLLQGVTGSGKTLLYIQAIREVIEQGKQAIFLLPEIGLTTQLVRRLQAYFGEELGVYHSKFSNNERIEIWEKVQQGKYKVVVGPRSAIWLPYQQLGIIICDEEHDSSYKQRDPAPRFHARDAAIYLAGLHKAQVILGSATPSIESLYNVMQKKYAYASLKERYLGVKMPAIEFVNSKSLETVKKFGFQILTPELQVAMGKALAEKRQIILFQNRRGYAPFQICTLCGWVPQCSNCAVSLTYHKSTDKMHCHYCGLSTLPPQTCAQCGSNKIRFKSFGTEKIEEEVKMAFPEARVARMDIDSMRGRNALPRLLDSMEAQETDILVGTQMVVKGLDFAPVALVAILAADSLLSFPDFRVNERGFQLMEQVSGRAGRADGDGRVIIQAYNTHHQVLRWVHDHDVNAYYKGEIGFRELFNYPPFSRMIRVVVKHKELENAEAAASQMAEALAKWEGIAVQGPVPGLIPRVRNQYVEELWLKCPKDGRVLAELKDFLKKLKLQIIGQRGHGGIQVILDVDPV